MNRLKKEREREKMCLMFRRPHNINTTLAFLFVLFASILPRSKSRVALS